MNLPYLITRLRNKGRPAAAACMLLAATHSHATSVFLSATANGDQIVLSWTASGALKSAQVYRDTDSDPNGRVRIATLSGATTTFVDASPSPGQAYWYWIKFTDANEAKGNSNAATTTVGERAQGIALVTLGHMSWGFYDSTATSYPAQASDITAAMNQAINDYNTVAQYAIHVPVGYTTDPGTTANANYGGSINFGNQRTARTAQHELSHFLGMQPSTSGWETFSFDGVWHGATGVSRMHLYKGDSETLYSENTNGHFWDYGLNFDDEWSYLSKGRNIGMVSALRGDLGIADGMATGPVGSYRLVNRSTQRMLAQAGATSGSVVEAASTTSSRQVWTASFQNGLVTLGNASSALYLGDAGAGPLLGAAPSVPGGQLWEMLPTDSGYFQLMNHASGNCLMSGGSAGNPTMGACNTATDTTVGPLEWHLAK